METGNFKIGDLVKFKEPLNEEEKKLVFKVLENCENRIIVEEITILNEWILKPTFVYLSNELTKINK